MNVLTKTTALVALLFSMMAGAGSAQAAPSRDEQRIRDAFGRGVGGPESFYALLAEDVHWTVARAQNPSVYTSRQDFLDRGARPVLDRLTGPIEASVHDLIIDGDQVVALWRGTATALDGKPYVNEYAWSMTMRGGEIARVVAYLDLVALDDLIRRVPV
ncbi:MAG: nuclear transport factor 2 family protein [Mycolicibacterium neoaurum]|uniref:nuclear transport factor 2 family protein n=1 Tax=Mycolicibacterium neoaurum TaxID=1795 RepID=UPI002FF6F1FD